MGPIFGGMQRGGCRDGREASNGRIRGNPKTRGFCAFTVCVQRYNVLSRNSSRIPLVNNFRFAQNAAWIDELTCSEMLNEVCNIYNLTNQCYEFIDEVTFDFVAQELEGYLKQIK